MIVNTIVDTGPLVALLLADESQHDWAARTFSELPADGIVTCEAVVSETCFLIGRVARAHDALFRRIMDGTVRLLPMDKDASAIHAMMKKYRNVPASYADACLVRLSELFPSASVITLDSDFRIYRRNGRQPIPLIIPAR